MKGLVKEITELIDRLLFFEAMEKIEGVKSLSLDLINLYSACLEGTLQYEKASALHEKYNFPNKDSRMAKVSERLLRKEMQTERYHALMEHNLKFSSLKNWRPQAVDYTAFSDEQITDSINITFDAELVFELLQRSVSGRKYDQINTMLNVLIHRGYFTTGMAETYCLIYINDQNFNGLLKFIEKSTYIEWIDPKIFEQAKNEALIRSGNRIKALSDSKIQEKVKNYDNRLRAAASKSDRNEQLKILKEAENAGYNSSSVLRAKLSLFAKDNIDVIRDAELYIKNSGTDQLYVPLIRAYETRGLYDKAYELVRSWKKQLKEINNFDPSDYKKNLEGAVNASLRAPNNASNDRRPHVFIVGLPRSGTTIAEKLVYSTGKYISLGESTALWRFFDLYGYPTTVKSIVMLRDFFLSENNIPEQSVFVDKCTINYQIAPYLRKIFPECKIIYCTKDQKINAWSLYKASLSGPNLDYVNSKTEIERCIKYEREIMEYYVNLDQSIFVLKNETLINNTCETLASLSEWLGHEVSFDDATDYTTYTHSMGQLEKLRTNVDKSYRNYRQYWSYLS
jgi:hypothetical protein